MAAGPDGASVIGGLGAHSIRCPGVRHTEWKPATLILSLMRDRGSSEDRHVLHSHPRHETEHLSMK